MLFSMKDDCVTDTRPKIEQMVRERLMARSPEERASRSPLRKLREIVLANELARQYKPDEILEIYLNEINYANLAYGIEA